MNKKSIISIIVGILLIILGLVLLFGGRGSSGGSNNTNTDSNSTNKPATPLTPTIIATINVYNNTGEDVINTIDITEEDKGTELKGFVDQLAPLGDSEMPGLVLTRTVEIKYGDSVIINIQTGEDGYCIYSADGGSTTSMSKMPAGLVDWLKTHIL